MRSRNQTVILALLASVLAVGCATERTVTRHETVTTVPVEPAVTRRTTVETVPAAPVVETETTVRKQQRSTTIETY